MSLSKEQRSTLQTIEYVQGNEWGTSKLRDRIETDSFGSLTCSIEELRIMGFIQSVGIFEYELTVKGERIVSQIASY